MSGKNTAVFGIYPDRASVENAVDTLASAGFRTEDISVLLPENVGTKDFAHEKHTKAPEGAVAGWAAVTRNINKETAMPKASAAKSPRDLIRMGAL